MSIPPGASASVILNFLFRRDEGVIERGVWWRGSIFLAVCLALLTAIWMEISTFAYEAQGPAARTELFDPNIFAAYAYLIFFGFCVLLISICHYNLSAKRWRARGKPPAFAGLLPLLALFSGAAHWLYPRVSESMPYWTVSITDAVLVVVIVWNVVELGLLASRPGGEAGHNP